MRRILHQPLHAQHQSGPHIGHVVMGRHPYSSEHCSHGSGSRSHVSNVMLQLQSSSSAFASTLHERTTFARRSESGSRLADIVTFGPSVTNKFVVAVGPSTVRASLKTRAIVALRSSDVPGANTS